jgi:formiminotetrahydrofolate cyclodeaminase
VNVGSRFGDLSIQTFASRLASADPVPGGGSASAVAASLGASLVAMVAALSEGRPRYAEHAELHASAGAAARALSAELLALADEDAAAYAAFSSALKLPRATDEEVDRRTGAIRRAARTAAEVPLRCVETCVRVVILAESLAGRSNPNASSDLAVASLLAEAGGRGAAANVLVNQPSVGDLDWADATQRRVDELLGELERLGAATREVVAGGEPRPPLAAAELGLA